MLPSDVERRCALLLSHFQAWGVLLERTELCSSSYHLPPLGHCHIFLVPGFSLCIPIPPATPSLPPCLTAELELQGGAGAGPPHALRPVFLALSPGPTHCTRPDQTWPGVDRWADCQSAAPRRQGWLVTESSGIP